MRTDLAFTALAFESNRYRLTRLVARATRMLHRPNTRVQDTMNDDSSGSAAPNQEQPPCRGSGRLFGKRSCMMARSPSKLSPP